MTSIDMTVGRITHINVFETTPDKQQALVDSLIASVNEASKVPGWISATIHKSPDGRFVTNYVQFESDEAARAVLQRLAQTGHLQRNTALGRVSPGQYEVAYSLSR